MILRHRKFISSLICLVQVSSVVLLLSCSVVLALVAKTTTVGTQQEQQPRLHNAPVIYNYVSSRNNSKLVVPVQPLPQSSIGVVYNRQGVEDGDYEDEDEELEKVVRGSLKEDAWN